MLVIKNKRGGEKLLSIWWFFVLGVVGGGIVIGILIYYGADVDVRQVEANIFADKIIDCISNGNRLEGEFFEGDFDLLSYCKIDSSQFDVFGNYFYEIELSGLDFPFYLSRGANRIKADCEISKLISVSNPPGCVEKSKVLYYADKKLNLKIFVASNNVGETISFLD